MATKMHITYSHLVVNFKIYIYFMRINVLSARMYVCHVCSAGRSHKRAWDHLELELETLVAAMWALNLSFLQQQPGLLTTEPSLVPRYKTSQTRMSETYSPQLTAHTCLFNKHHVLGGGGGRQWTNKPQRQVHALSCLRPVLIIFCLKAGQRLCDHMAENFTRN